MEEKKPQDLEINVEETEQVAELSDAIEEEIFEAEAEEEEQADSISGEDESYGEEEWIEETTETESVQDEITKESTEVLVAEDSTKEDAEEELTIKEATSLEEVVEETGTQTPIEEPKSDALQEGSVPTKQMSAGIVIKLWQLAVAIAVVVAMVFGGMAFGIALGNKNQSNFNDSPVDYEWVLPQGGSTNKDQIVLPGYDKLVIPAGEKQIEIVLPNPKGNPCYFRYTLVLQETGEILYQSKLIPPGKAVLQIELSRPLPVGDYTLLIGIDSISLADGRTPMNGGEGKALLQVR